MNRLTKNDVKEMGMLDLSHNQVFVKDREAWYRDFDMEITARDLAQAMFARNGIECPSDNEEFDEYMLELLQDGYETIDGMIALYYNALWAFADVREILKEYEDLEEQGLLIKLPVGMGDTIVNQFHEEWQVQKIDIYKDGNIVFRCGHEGTEDYSAYHLSYYKKDWWRKEEAEKALEGK